MRASRNNCMGREDQGAPTGRARKRSGAILCSMFIIVDLLHTRAELGREIHGHIRGGIWATVQPRTIVKRSGMEMMAAGSRGGVAGLEIHQQATTPEACGSSGQRVTEHEREGECKTEFSPRCLGCAREWGVKMGLTRGVANMSHFGAMWQFFGGITADGATMRPFFAPNVPHLLVFMGPAPKWNSC